VFDNAQPCGGSVASGLLLRLAVITGDQEYAVKATVPLRRLRELMGRAPAGTGQWLAALDFYLSQPKEIAIVGPRDDQATQRLLDTVLGRYLPNKVVVGTDPSASGVAGPASTQPHIPLLQDRGMVEGRPTAYVCRNYACQLPVTDPAALAEQLGD
jgi:uncharacterized protein YyaL (SSP411 family)